ncbi:MAG TPA: hypothetical protein VHE35_25565 [Kofleriaceae bacterium]|nr:hypothetical protein [Kofleriaceae bacterium]
MTTTRGHGAVLGVLAAAVLAGACGDNLGAPVDAPPPVDAHVASRTIFLDFGGATLHPGAPSGADDTTPLVDADTVLPPYLDGDAGRQARIDAIVVAAQTRLAPYDVALALERPAAGPYFHVVVTGSGALFDAPGLSAMAPYDCARPGDDGVALLFQSGAAADTYGPIAKGNLVLGALGLAHLIPPSSKPHDCMCWAAAGCTVDEVACTAGGPGTPVDTRVACPGAPATMDEHQLLLDAFGARP